jgi:hypothetical protein
MGKILKTVQQRMERFQKKQKKLDELTQQAWGDTADNFRAQDMRSGNAELMVAAVIKSHTDKDVANSAPSTFGELMESLDIIPRISQMRHGTSQPRSCHLRRGSGRPQSNKRIGTLPPVVDTDS